MFFDSGEKWDLKNSHWWCIKKNLLCSLLFTRSGPMGANVSDGNISNILAAVTRASEHSAASFPLCCSERGQETTIRGLQNLWKLWWGNYSQIYLNCSIKGRYRKDIIINNKGYPNTHKQQQTALLYISSAHCLCRPDGRADRWVQ